MRRKTKDILMFGLLGIIALSSLYVCYYYYQNYVKERPIYTASKDTTVFIQKPVADALKIMWESHDTEYFICLNGYQKGSDVFITSLESTKIIYSNQTAVTHYCCDSRDSIADLHNHNNGAYDMSLEDIYGFGRCKTNYKAVQYGQQQFAFYSPNNLYDAYNFRII